MALWLALECKESVSRAEASAICVRLAPPSAWRFLSWTWSLCHWCSVAHRVAFHILVARKFAAVFPLSVHLDLIETIPMSHVGSDVSMSRRSS